MNGVLSVLTFFAPFLLNFQRDFLWIIFEVPMQYFTRSLLSFALLIFCASCHAQHAEHASAYSDPQPSADILRPGDVLQITVWKEDGMDREIIVLPDGTITYPLVGTLNVAGQTTSQVQNTIKERLKRFIPEASVTVIIKAALGHAVSVIGQVNKPGELVMGHRLTVMQALSQAGGLTPYADESGIKILRRDEQNNESAIPFDYSDISSGRKLEKDIVLNPGDVVVVPTAGLF